MRSLPRAPESVHDSHTLEREVCRELLGHPNLRFSSLVVRRIETGVVCLEGVLHVEEDAEPEIERLALQIAGVDTVLNHLLVRPEASDACGDSRRICRTPK